MPADTYEAPVERVLRFLKEEFKDKPFKSFYDSDPDAIPSFNLPCVIVEKQRDTTGPGPTGLRAVNEEILINVVFDKSDDWDAQSDEADLTKRKIRQIVEARDKTTKQYLPNSIKGALRTKLAMDDATIGDDMTFELGVLPRPDDVITAEGHLTITVSYYVPYV